MRLTLYTDFALRTLIYLGINDGKQAKIKDIARSFGISKPHLMKVVNHLSQEGYLDAVRGRNGGIRLMREPHHINIGQVVRDTEDQLNVIGCLERKGYCPIERACVLRSALRDATQAFLAVLDTYTLADLIKPQKVLSSLLLDRHVSLRNTPNKQVQRRPSPTSSRGSRTKGGSHGQKSMERSASAPNESEARPLTATPSLHGEHAGKRAATASRSPA